MIVLYTAVRVFVLLLWAFCALRAKHFLKLFTVVTKDVEFASLLLEQDRKRNAAGDAFDPAAYARAMQAGLRLGGLCDKRIHQSDRLDRWASRRDGLANVNGYMRQLRGKALPYTLGFMDVASLLFLLEHYGISSADVANQVIALVMPLWQTVLTAIS